MSGALIRLTDSLSNKPMLTTQPHLEKVVEYLTDRNSGVKELKIDLNRKERIDRDTVDFNQDTGIGIISIDGSLTYLSYVGLCGDVGISYKKIKAEFDYLVKAGAKVIVFDQDSNGGEAYMAFETAKEIRKIADEKGIKLISYVDGSSFSASYVFSSICHEVIVNPQGEVGSIGVVVALMNTNKAEINRGYERLYIYSGKSKVPFSADGNWDVEWVKDLQGKVDVLYGEFVSHVGEYRNIETAAILDIGAKTFFGADAVELGLADKVMTHAELGEYLANLNDEEEEELAIKSMFKTKQGVAEAATSAESNTDMTLLEELQNTVTAQSEQLTQAQEGFIALQSEFDETVATLKAANEALQASLDEALGVTSKMVENSRKARLKAATNEDTATTLFASMSTLSDEAFDAIVTSLESQKEAMAESFEEVGSIGAEVETPKPKSKTLAMAEAAYKQQ